MPIHIIKVVRKYEYQVSVNAPDEYEAIEIVRDYEIEDLEPHEVDASFDFECVLSEVN